MSACARGECGHADGSLGPVSHELACPRATLESNPQNISSSLKKERKRPRGHPAPACNQSRLLELGFYSVVQYCKEHIIKIKIAVPVN